MTLGSEGLDFYFIFVFVSELLPYYKIFKRNLYSLLSVLRTSSTENKKKSLLEIYVNCSKSMTKFPNESNFFFKIVSLSNSPNYVNGNDSKILKFTRQSVFPRERYFL